MVKSNLVKGFRDFVGNEARKRARILEIIRKEFELYGFEPAETPVVEFEEFVKGENSNDDAVRDVFKLKDRGKRKLALRYEFTFQLKRLAKNQKLPYKRFQIDYVFRDEGVKKGRSRQFVQCDIDVVGSSLKDEAEVLAVVDRIFKKLGIKIKIYFNNRKLLNEILVSENIKERNREQVIRELDKLDKLSEKEVADNLKKLGAEKLLKIFKKGNFEDYNFYKEIKDLKKLCKSYGVVPEFRPYLARGLSYYTGSIFEVWSDELDVSLAGGGSYLVSETQACGIAFGFEPIFLLSKIEGDGVKVQIISISEDNKAIRLAEKLRENGVSVNLVLDKSIGKALEYANSKGVEKVVFVGKDEVEKKKFKVKDMESGSEKFLSVDEVLKLFD